MAVAFDHVVLGAAGGTGSSVVRELAARGLRVRAVTRSGTADVPEGVEQVAADVGTTDGARRACESAAVVYHCAQPDYRRWPELFPPLTQAILDGAANADAKLVFADNLYMYGPPDGSSAIYDSSPLQRRLRDAHVATQHMLVAPATWELTGRLLLGLPTDLTQL